MKIEIAGQVGAFKKLAFETLLTSSFRFWLKRNDQPIRGSIRFFLLCFVVVFYLL
ncbi:hypothetical protein Hanom_Chr05g00436561 [Helianthus anomalus]